MVDLFVQQYQDGHRVKDTADLRRVLALPRRHLPDWEQTAKELGAVLRLPKGKMALRDVQARPLYDLGTVGGLFAPMRVGAGKTLVSFLAATVTFSLRPLLLVPAKLVAKTQRELVVAMAHWDIVSPRIMTYEWLGRVQGADALDKYEPDIIVADECHKLKNTKAAVTRRVSRWFKQHDETKCVLMSGTMTKRSIHDYAHMLMWVYGPQDYPLPVTYNEREVWADALDARKQQRLAHPGALKLFCNEEETKLWEQQDERKAARTAYRRHLVNTPGVIATTETPIDSSLTVQSVSPDVSAKVEHAFFELRSLWETPDGWPLADGLEMFRHARELALGFYYKWDPRPERSWLDPRKIWCSFVRKKINNSNRWDSELQVRQEFPNAPELLDWLAVRDTFTPNTVPVWIDDFLIPVVEKWAKNNRGIVWVEHRCVGERLEEETGLTYYGRRGMSKQGKPIEDHPPNQPLIASIQSNSEGRNLQAWCRNLIVSPPPNGAQWEQLLGRTHRDGQEADEVAVDVLMTCSEHVTAFAQAVKDSEYVQDSTGSPQKLLLADITVLGVEDVMGRQSKRWALRWN